jgi:hypothetical protein
MPLFWLSFAQHQQQQQQVTHLCPRGGVPAQRQRHVISSCQSTAAMVMVTMTAMLLLLLLPACVSASAVGYQQQ